MDFEKNNYWALILGGSSGMGLASALRLAQAGMNICVVHRDRRGSMTKVEEEFAKIQATGVKFVAFNTNALSAEGRKEVLNGMLDYLAGAKIRTVLHSIALGNLKLMTAKKIHSNHNTINKLAQQLQVDPEILKHSIDQVFASGEADHLVELATPPQYSDDHLLQEEDMAQTIYNMGTSLLTWVQDLHQHNMLASDARVLGLTSEGNEIAWRSYGAVSAAKCALEAISRSIAKEFAPYGIRCNILQPGVTDTPALRLIPGNLHMKAHATLRNPFHRLTTPQDVANVVYLMSKDEASWINGSIIRVDGGEHISG